MIWSLVKILVFVAVVALATSAVGMLLQTGGGIRIAAGGWEMSLGPLQAVIAALVLLAAVWLLLRLVGLLVAFLRFLNGDETALTRYFDRNRERKGYQALNDALMALASGEGRLALSRAARAERNLQRPELTDLITAQAAEMAGDRQKAAATYRRMLDDQRTRFVGIRGLMKQKLAEGDTETALKLAQKAFALKPRHEELQDTLLALQAGAGDWAGARQTLHAKTRAGALPRDLFRRRDAALALEEARVHAAAGRDAEAGEIAIAANRKSPDLVPGAAMAARAFIARGKPRMAARVIARAWEITPHPELAAAFAEIAPDESATERLKRFRMLTAMHPEAGETRLLLAELHLADEDFPAARRALGRLAEDHPTTRSLAIMAAIERGEGSDDTVIRGWLTRAISAPRGPQWVCGRCERVHPQWHPVCSHCGGFDTFEWREVDTEDMPPGHSDLLPLIVSPGVREADPAPADPDAGAVPKTGPDGPVEAPAQADTPAPAGETTSGRTAGERRAGGEN